MRVATMDIKQLHIQTLNHLTDILIGHVEDGMCTYDEVKEQFNQIDNLKIKIILSEDFTSEEKKQYKQFANELIKYTI